MWALFRPDANRAMQNPIVQQTFPRYYNLLQNQVTARYLLAKELSIDDQIKLSSDEDNLWDEHSRCQAIFEEIVLKSDEEEHHEIKGNNKAINYLDLKIELSKRLMDPCRLCERGCNRKRHHNEIGFCLVRDEGTIASAFLHMGEEPVLVPSGTIFFNGCTFRCVFCQNWDIAQEWRKGKRKILKKGSIKQTLIKIETELARNGARNLNYVGGDPTPNLSNILQSWQKLDINICQLWNSNHFLSKFSQELLVDVIDFWLPDLKYWDNDFAFRMSKIKNYREVLTRNLKRCTEIGSGEIIIRHLVMPGRVETDTIPILNWIAEELHPTGKVMINIMAQYRPEHKVLKEDRWQFIKRRVNQREMDLAHETAEELGLKWKIVS
ncbi:MAG: radical SAM protein [Candidatus Hodarchaeales archaeon]|jgi:putative pyruvate formate lyase activating enzyme